MTDLITVEDFNSALINYKDSFEYMIDLTKFPEDTEHFKYDFIDVTYSPYNNYHRYTLVFKNDLWTRTLRNTGNLASGAILKDMLDEETYRIRFTLTEQAKEVNGGIALLMFPLHEETNITLSALKVSLEPPFRFAEGGALVYYFMVENYNTNDTYKLTFFKGEVRRSINARTERISSNIMKVYESVSMGFIPEVIKLEVYSNGTNTANFYFNGGIFKNANFISPPSSVTVAKKNAPITLPVYNAEFQSWGGLSYTVKYENQVFEGVISSSNQEINLELDLSQKVDLSPIKLDVKLGETRFIEGESQTYYVPCSYEQIDNYAELAASLNDENGARIIEVNEDIALSADIELNHDVIIRGNDNQIDLQEHSLILSENVSAHIYNWNFENADTALIQKEGTNLEIIDCSFSDCTATQYGGLGSCIHCDTDLDGLNTSDDFITKVRNTSFANCHGAISHGGELIIDSCQYLLNDPDCINVNSAAFLYMSDGVASIRNSIFDINLDTDYFCENELDIGIAHCLVKLGADAVFNGSPCYEVQRDEALPLFDNHSNISHVFVKYYYPPIENCVYVSPVVNREDKNVCYAITGIDWIFKENVQITRADWGTENRINNISW